MRNGDCYKIVGMSKSGVSDSDIVKHFRHRYSEDEVLNFIPGVKKKTKAKKKAKAEAE